MTFLKRGHWLNPRRMFSWMWALPVGVVAVVLFLALWPGLWFDCEIYSNGRKRIAVHREITSLGEENFRIDFWSGWLTWDRGPEQNQDFDFNPNFEVSTQSPRIVLGASITTHHHEFWINWEGF